MTHLHPRGVNHLALSTTDMKGSSSSGATSSAFR